MSDPALFQMGMVNKVTEILEPMGVQTKVGGWCRVTPAAQHTCSCCWCTYIDMPPCPLPVFC